MTKTFYSNGKLLISGEYGVLDGALALAVPTKFGQSLTVSPSINGDIRWVSLDLKGQPWFDVTFNHDLQILDASDVGMANSLKGILTETRYLNPSFLVSSDGYSIHTKLGFPRQWGLGSSSTLINNIASWANVDPYLLLEKTFGGSGYDIACAQIDSPITFRLHNGKPKVEPIAFDPSYATHLYFVYRNRKQDSREAIARYRKGNFEKPTLIRQLTLLTRSMLKDNSVEEFQYLMESHENVLSKVLQKPPIKEELFNDLEGTIKSLGGWGGDFILACSTKKPFDYFKDKGFETVLPYDQMVL